MAISGLSLPVDIPWHRLCVSEDMLDTKFCDLRFPYRWRSSVGVFSDDQQQQEDIIVSYLRVVCTITGFQPDFRGSRPEKPARRARNYLGAVIVNEGKRRFFEPVPARTWLLGVNAAYAF